MVLVSSLLVAATWLIGAKAGDACDISQKDIGRTLSARGINPSRFWHGANSTGCAAACSALLEAYGPDKVISRSPAQSTQYLAAKAGFWSQQQQAADPFCIYKPSNNIGVSSAVLVARLTKCPFAVKSGGHAAFFKASNSDGGITISFDDMKAIVVSPDKKIASVEPGNTWGPVYKTLEAQGLAIIGGRVFNIGTGGLTLGGGISFFSNRLGWATDNVNSYEVVLANGKIVIASEFQNCELYKALRGGGNNFGIVTKFNFDAFPLPGSIWGGTRYIDPVNASALTRAFVKVNADADTDVYAGTWLQNVWAGPLHLFGAERWYSKPDGEQSPIWKPYLDVPAQSDDAKNLGLSEYATKIGQYQPRGFRQIFYTITIKNDADLTVFATEVFNRNVQSVLSVTGLIAAQTFQTIATPAIRQMQKRGGNAYSFDPEDGPYQILLLNPQWNLAADDKAIYDFVSKTAKEIQAEAERKGLKVDYLYMNYASQYQDVIASYGEDEKDALIETARQYDPRGIFQKLQPGYFKLNRAPVPDTDYFNF